MTLFAYLNGSDIGYRVRLNGFGLSTRADGSAGFGGIVFDDSAGTLDVRGWMSVEVRETACTTAPILFKGYVADRTYSRNGESQYRIGSARWIDANLVDQNAALHVRLITNPDGKRPAETHNERIDWLVASAYLSDLIDSDSLVDTSSPKNFEAADYRGQYPDDVLADISAPIFRIFFVYVSPLSGDRILFFDTPGSTVSTSTLTISNVLSDLSSTCFAPSLDATLTRDPSEVYAKVRYTYAKGVVIENETSTRDTFFSDNGLGYRGLQVDNSRIGAESSARTAADSILSRDSEENDTIAVTVQLPAANAGLIRAGQRIGVRFTHLPGYETLTYTRVTGLTIRQSAGTPDFYDLALELNAHGRSGGGGGGAPGPDQFPHNPPPVTTHYYEGSLFHFQHAFGPDEPPSEMSTSAGFTADELFNYSLTIPSETYTGTTSFAGFWLWDLETDSPILALPSMTYVAGSVITGSFTTPTGFVGTHQMEARWRVIHNDVRDASATVEFWVDPDGWVISAPEDPVMPAQPFGPTLPAETPDGSTTTFTLPAGYEFADGSLRVYVDRLDQSAAITSYDGAARTFTLSFAPWGTDTIEAYGQGR